MGIPQQCVKSSETWLTYFYLICLFVRSVTCKLMSLGQDHCYKGCHVQFKNKASYTISWCINIMLNALVGIDWTMCMYRFIQKPTNKALFDSNTLLLFLFHVYGRSFFTNRFSVLQTKRVLKLSVTAALWNLSAYILQSTVSTLSHTFSL